MGRLYKTLPPTTTEYILIQCTFAYLLKLILGHKNCLNRSQRIYILQNKSLGHS